MRCVEVDSKWRRATRGGCSEERREKGESAVGLIQMARCGANADQTGLREPQRSVKRPLQNAKLYW
jgi:hypothetical protein